MGPRPARGVLQDVIGMVEGGPKDLFEKTGEKFRALLLARRAARR